MLNIGSKAEDWSWGLVGSRVEREVERVLRLGLKLKGDEGEKGMSVGGIQGVKLEKLERSFGEVGAGRRVVRG